MLWNDFYDRYPSWADSTLKSKISTLKNIGSGKEVVEVCLDIDDYTIRSQLIRKAIKLGVKFKDDDLNCLNWELPEDVWDEIEIYTKSNPPKKRKSLAGKAVAIGAVIGVFQGLFGNKKQHK